MERTEPVCQAGSMAMRANARMGTVEERGLRESNRRGAAVGPSYRIIRFLIVCIDVRYECTRLHE